MKKSVIITVAMCLASLMANAQWKVESVESGQANTKLLQVLNTDNSTLVYATYEMDLPDATFEDFYLGRKTHVKVNGEKYKLINSVNFPMQNDAEQTYAHLCPGHNEFNFVMEFEKFPVEGGFELLDGHDKEGPYSFNFHGIKVSPIDSTKVINTARFLDKGTPVIYGNKVIDGNNYQYQIRDGVCVTCHAVVVDGDWFSTNEMFHIDIVNNSDHGIMFDFDKVYVVGRKYKKNGKVEEKGWKKFTPDSYDQFLAQQDYDEARRQTSSVLDEVGRQLDREKYHTNYGSWERIGWEALAALNQHAIDNRVEQYMKEHPHDRPRALRSQGIQPGESIHGYIASERKKADKATITIPMDDYDFEFVWNVK